MLCVVGTSVVPWLFVALWDVGGGTLAFPITLGLAPGLGLVLTARLYQWAKQVPLKTINSACRG